MSYRRVTMRIPFGAMPGCAGFGGSGARLGSGLRAGSLRPSASLRETRGRYMPIRETPTRAWDNVASISGSFVTQHEFAEFASPCGKAAYEKDDTGVGIASEASEGSAAL